MASYRAITHGIGRVHTYLLQRREARVRVRPRPWHRDKLVRSLPTPRAVLSLQLPLSPAPGWLRACAARVQALDAHQARVFPCPRVRTKALLFHSVFLIHPIRKITRLLVRIKVVSSYAAKPLLHGGDHVSGCNRCARQRAINSTSD